MDNRIVNTDSASNSASAHLKIVLENYLREKRENKTAKKSNISKSDLEEVYKPSVWYSHAASRAKTIQVITHSLKPLHPKAKGTTLYCEISSLPSIDEVGSHCLGNNFYADISVDAKNTEDLDVYNFLMIKFEGRTVLQMCIEKCPVLRDALSDNPDESLKWMRDLSEVVKIKGILKSHNMAKQIFWLVGDDPNNNSHFHLLGILYPTSLIHKVYEKIDSDKFGIDAKETRNAKKNALWSDKCVRDYPDLAIQKIGGSHPQNISQLNNKRKGKNILLASFPPTWKLTNIKIPNATASLFKVFEKESIVLIIVNELIDFLKNDPKPNINTRLKRDSMVKRLIEEFIDYTIRLRSLEPNWSSSLQCKLALNHRDWLDPKRENSQFSTSTFEAIAKDFSNWLNSKLESTLPVGDPEFFHWKKLFFESLWQTFEGKE